MIARTSPAETEAPSTTFSSSTLPARCAVISFSIFIASITQIRSPSATSAPFSTATLKTVPCSGDGQRLARGAGAAAGFALALRRLAAAGAAGRGDPGDGLADHLDVEELAGDLDLVVAGDRLRALLGRGRRGGLIGGGRLEPLPVLHQVAAGLAVGPLLGGEDRLVEGDQRGQAADLVLAERAQHAPGRLLAVDVPDDQLGHHRVVHRRHLGPRFDPRVDPHPGTGRLAVGGDRARRRGEVLVGGLGVDPALDRPAAQLDLLLGDRELLAGGDQDLLADDVDAGDHLGHAVLDLDPGVHLEEEVLVADLHALDRAGAAVADRRRRVGRDPADPLAHLGVHMGARGLLDHLLVAALDRAVALAEVDHVAVRVGEHLDLDVARVLEVALDVDPVVGEELLAFARGALEGLLELVRGHRDPEALAAPAPRRLAGDRVAGFLGLLAGGLDVVGGLGRAGHDRHAGLGHDLACPRLRAHRFDRLRRRADEDDAGLGAGLGEVGVLGEESVAGVNRLGARLLRRLDDLGDVEVAFRRHGGADQERLVGLADVRGVAVDLRVDGDRADPHLLQRARDADRDLAAVCDQNLLEHHCSWPFIGGAVY